MAKEQKPPYVINQEVTLKNLDEEIRRLQLARAAAQKALDKMRATGTQEKEAHAPKKTRGRKSRKALGTGYGSTGLVRTDEPLYGNTPDRTVGKPEVMP